MPDKEEGSGEERRLGQKRTGQGRRKQYIFNMWRVKNENLILFELSYFHLKV